MLRKRSHATGAATVTERIPTSTGIAFPRRVRIASVGMTSPRQKFPMAGTQPGSWATLLFGLQTGERGFEQGGLLALMDLQAPRRRTGAFFARDAAQRDAQSPLRVELRVAPRAHVLRLLLDPVELVCVSE